MGAQWELQADGRNPKDQRRKTDGMEQDTQNQNENERKGPFKPGGHHTGKPTEGKEERMRGEREKEKMEIGGGIMEIGKIEEEKMEIVVGIIEIEKIRAGKRRKTGRREQDTQNQKEKKRKGPFKPSGHHTRKPTEMKAERMREEREGEKMEIVVGIIEIEKI